MSAGVYGGCHQRNWVVPRRMPSSLWGWRLYFCLKKAAPAVPGGRETLQIEGGNGLLAYADSAGIKSITIDFSKFHTFDISIGF